MLALAAANVGLVGALHEQTPDRKRRGAEAAGSGSIDEALESGYPQTRWVREKTRKRAPPTLAPSTFSTVVERDVDFNKYLQMQRFYSRQGVLRAPRDAAMLAAA